MRAILPSIAALLLAVVILTLGNGLLGILIPFRAQGEGFSTLAIGLIGSGFFIGYALGCFGTPHLVRRVGHIRSFAVLAALFAVTTLLLVLLMHPLTWVFIRLLGGFCSAGLAMIIESWLNEKTDAANRGAVFSLYMILNFLGVTAGQFLLGSGDPSGIMLFMVATIFVLLSLVPVSLTLSPQPQPLTAVRLDLAGLYRTSPVALVGVLCIGLANSAYGAMGPAFAHTAGMTARDVALFMNAALVGGALLQWPLGWLSDRMDRRYVLLLVCLLGGLATLGLFATPASRHALLTLQALFLGGFIFSTYSLCIAHANDHVSGHNFVTLSGSLLLVFAVGASFGPAAASLVMARFGAEYLFVYVGAVYLFFALFTLQRIITRAGAPEALRTAFLPTPVRTTPESYQLDPRADENSGGLS